MIRRRSPIKRSSPPRRKKAVSRRPKSAYRKKVQYANDLWRRLIYLKSSDGMCVRCGKRPLAQAMHLFAKGPYPRNRFDLDNGAPGCIPCHRRIDSDHEAKREFCIKYLGGVDAYEAMKLRVNARGKSDIDLTILYLEQQAMEAGLGEHVKASAKEAC